MQGFMNKISDVLVSALVMAIRITFGGLIFWYEPPATTLAGRHSIVIVLVPLFFAVLLRPSSIEQPKTFFRERHGRELFLLFLRH